MEIGEGDYTYLRVKSKQAGRGVIIHFIDIGGSWGEWSVRVLLLSVCSFCELHLNGYGKPRRPKGGGGGKDNNSRTRGQVATAATLKVEGVRGRNFTLQREEGGEWFPPVYNV